MYLLSTDRTMFYIIFDIYIVLITESQFLLQNSSLKGRCSIVLFRVIMMISLVGFGFFMI